MVEAYRMKTVIFLLAAFCGSVFAAGNDLVIPQRLADDSQPINRLVAKPAGTNDGVLGYLGSTQRPYFLGIGPGLSLSNGVLDSSASAPTWGAITGKPSFSAVATSGAYADLSGKPTIPAAQVNSDWSATTGAAQILNKPALFSGAYSSLTGVPTSFAPSAHTQAWSTITATPTTLSGYGITDAATASQLAGKLNTPSGTTAQYLRGDGSLAAFPAIPAAQVQSDWNATSGASAILNKPFIAAQKRIETYTGVTDASGLCTVTYSTAYPAVPSVQPGPPSDSMQSWILVSSTATGFSVRLVQRAVLTVVSVQVLAGVVSNVPSAPCQVLVVGQ